MQDPPEQSRLNLVRTPTILQCTPRAVLTNAQRLLCRTCISSAAYSMVCVPEPKRRDIRIYRWIRKCHYSFRGDPYIRRTPCNTSQWAQQIRDVLQTCGSFANLSWCLVHFPPLHFVPRLRTVLRELADSIPRDRAPMDPESLCPRRTARYISLILPRPLYKAPSAHTPWLFVHSRGPRIPTYASSSRYQRLTPALISPTYPPLAHPFCIGRQAPHSA